VLAEWTRPFDPIIAEALGQLPHWAMEPPQRAVSLIAHVGTEPSYTADWDGISPFVTPSVLWSLYSVLRSPAGYWGAICTAIEVGGDVDTTAAMTGAIAGASVGLSGIPKGPSQLISDRGADGYDILVRLATDLHQLHRKLRDGGS
jgi:ADP-ribosylglycohydrolase